MMKPKQLWLMAGGNGAGKSTFYQLYLAHRNVKFINADLIARKINPDNPESVGYEAAELAEMLRRSLLREGSCFCFETVFSHPSKIDFVADAKAAGYEAILVFIHLESSQLNEARVMQRVSEGGHRVPANKIKTRIPRTLKHIAKALPLFDEARLLDNSSRENPFLQIAVVKKGRRVWTTEPMPKWATEIFKDIQPG